MVTVCICYLYLVSLMEQESKTMEKGRLDSLLICSVDTLVCCFLYCLVDYTQALKSSKLEVFNMLV